MFFGIFLPSVEMAYTAYTIYDYIYVTIVQIPITIY